MLHAFKRRGVIYHYELTHPTEINSIDGVCFVCLEYSHEVNELTVVT